MKRQKAAAQSPTIPGHLFWLGILAVLVVVSLGSPLFSTSSVLSAPTADVASQFLYARAFGFGEIAQGRLPLWNPFIYSGVPFLGDFQSALLYPPNLIFVVVPLATAINWSFGLHVFLLGALTYAWAFRRGICQAAACLSGVLAMFSGTFFLHIYAGHLSNVCAMAWVPLIFLGIDGWIRQRHWGWILAAAGAAALQIFAGHPQYVYFTAVVAGIYALVHLPGIPRWPLLTVGLLAIYPFAAILAAAQLLPGLAAANESVRSGGVDYAFASMFSLPPENLLTLIAPWFFGGEAGAPYWGRCYFWEMNLFAGAGALLLAAFAMADSAARTRNLRLGSVLILALILALGAHTPVHHILYEWMPGFASFRGASKFGFFAGLLLALFAGFGLDRLLRGVPPTRAVGIAAGILGAVILGTAFWLGAAGTEGMKNLVTTMIATKESYLNPAILEAPELLQSLLENASHSLFIAGGIWISFAILWLAARRWQGLAPALGMAAALEITLFAGASVTTFALENFTYQPLAKYLNENPGDYRVLNTINPDSSMLLGKGNIWGYDPSVLKRYAQLMTVTQGGDPAQASQYLPFQAFHPIFSLLRCRMAFFPDGENRVSIKSFPEPFPHFFLVSDYEVIADPSRLLTTLKDPDFDLRNKVLLEQEPDPQPAPGDPAGSIEVLDSSTDHWTLKIQNAQAAILVIPDAYSRDWTVTSEPGRTQSSYTLLPANHALRAIPLAAGDHQFTMEYQPRGFRLGALISLLSWSLVIAGFAVPSLRRHLAFHA